MKITVNTSRFGRLEIDDTDIITVSGSLHDLPELKHFFVVDESSTTPFCWLQSISHAWAALPILPVDKLNFDYDSQIPAEDLFQLGLHAQEDAVIYVVVTFPPDILDSSVNLRAPLVFNTAARLVRQVELGGDWPEKLLFFDANLEEAPRRSSLNISLN